MTTATKPREPLVALHRVTYDRERSTDYAEVYPAQSDTTPGLVYTVVYEPANRLWRCECLAAQHGCTCRHVRRARRLRAVRWWSAMYLGWARAELAAERARLTARADAGPLWVDDLDALDALNWILGERETEAA